jgi:hypothetical protein
MSEVVTKQHDAVGVIDGPFADIWSLAAQK